VDRLSGVKDNDKRGSPLDIIIDLKGRQKKKKKENSA
jgi:hypothetical protein